MEPSKYLLDKVMEILQSNTSAVIDRSPYTVFDVNDNPNNLIISLVFVRDCNTLELNECLNTIIAGKGAVITLPGYWMGVSTDLAFPYIKNAINECYEALNNSMNDV